ncbi:putative ABC transport system ATP-binding protein [Gracilibacillus ureilyticus]|uniref:Putative ABC transport system ATP-binding protein n=1 Tax=Gracilibacillus ureilyticus TaxID=531814 RepID=A0A1H9Q809_9BACI|nr:ABC transporter ATP-binding protein [Gracilibacillus ureilyticus]SER56029.1 putative ABC transport system ATP-binding protein [Gracilibacillus ureilyticus]
MDTENAPILISEQVSRDYGSGKNIVRALRDASIKVDQGQLVILRGRSGSGKTTLLNILAGLDQPTSGKVIFNHKDLYALSSEQRDEFRQKDISIIFQSHALIPFMSAYENVEFGLRIAKIPVQERRKYAEEALTFVGLKERMHHRPDEMSGGEQQRTSIARAIACKPKVILADEPTAELDTKMGLQIMKLFKDLIEKEQVGIIMTSHDPAMLDIADQVYTLEDGEIIEAV